MLVSRIVGSALVLLIVLSTAVLAGGLMSILDSALTLEGDYDVLEAQIDNCSNGTCSEAAALEADLAGLSGELAQLHVEVTVCGCSNVTLDGIVSDLDAKDSDLHNTVASW